MPRTKSRVVSKTRTKRVARRTVTKATRQSRSTVRVFGTRRAADLLKLISDPTRMQAVSRLSHGSCNRKTLAESIGVSSSLLGHHIHYLRFGNVITCKRNGTSVIYSLTDTGRDLCQIIETVTS